MKKKRILLRIGLMFTLLVSLVTISSGYVKIWIVTDECCVEYPNNVCEYHYDDGSFACAFDGKPVY